MTGFLSVVPQLLDQRTKLKEPKNHRIMIIAAQRSAVDSKLIPVTIVVNSASMTNLLAILGLML